MKKLVLACAIACLSLAGCGGAGNVTEIDGTFVGQTSDGSQDVVIIASSGSGSSRPIHAYVSDGVSVSEFFSGSANGDLFDVTNADGEISGAIDSFGVSGNTSVNSSSRSYSAAPSQSPAGFYDVTVDMTAGTVQGTSADGSTLTGTIGTTLVGNSFSVSGTLTPSDGSPSNFTALITADSGGEQRWIVISDLSIKGGPVPGSGSGFVSPAP